MAGNTTPIHGRVCRVDKGGVLSDFSVDWSATINVDLAAANAQGDAWKKNLSGQAGGTGSITFLTVLGNTEQKAFVDNIIAAAPGVILTDVKLMLEDSGDYVSGDMFITSLGLNTSVGDVVKTSFSFTFNDTVALTVAI